MNQPSEVSRIVVIAETIVENQLIDIFTRVGAKAYTCVHGRGKGRRGVVEDPWISPEQSRVRIEILASQPIIDAIWSALIEKNFMQQRVIAFADKVQVYQEFS